MLLHSTAFLLLSCRWESPSQHQIEQQELSSVFGGSSGSDWAQFKPGLIPIILLEIMPANVALT